MRGALRTVLCAMLCCALQPGLAQSPELEPFFDAGLSPLHLEAPPKRSLSAKSCAGCHPRIARQWRSSRHAAAWSNEIFQASWRNWPNGWCLNCHVPLAEAQRDITGTGHTAVAGILVADPQRGEAGLPQEGVSCAVCHIRDGEILSANAPSRGASRAHPVRQEPRLGTSEFCAECHEFPFQLRHPRYPHTYGDEPLQETYTELSNSAAAGQQHCQDCHMQRASHRFPGGHTEGLVRKTVDVDVWPLASNQMQARISAVGAGHRVPTGDPFRRLELQLCSDKSCGSEVGRALIARTFLSTGETWRLAQDTTVPPPQSSDLTSARTLTVSVSEPASWWRLWYYYGDPRFHDQLPESQVRYLVVEGPTLSKSPVPD